jgi:uncharacterized protein YdeI (YjbR/CyaY-like superfamily)
MEQDNIFYFQTREEWRQWLQEHFDNKPEVWFVFPKKSSGKASVLYNDAVEEALCFGWIDSTVKTLDSHHKIQRFTPRKPNSHYSQANKERLTWLARNNSIHKRIKDDIQEIINEKYIFPADITTAIKKDKTAWQNFQHFSESYKRIRISYIDSARKRPDEFIKRLNNFIEKTRANKIIRGFGGIEKYY